MKSFVFLMIYWLKTIRHLNHLQNEDSEIKGWQVWKRKHFSADLKKSFCDLRCNANKLYTIDRNTFLFRAVTGSDHIFKKSIDSNVFATDELPSFYTRPFDACHFPVLLSNFPTPLGCWSKKRTNDRKITTKWSSPHFSAENYIATSWRQIRIKF